MDNRTNKQINKPTLQWTTTTWRGSVLSQESIDLIMLWQKVQKEVKNVTIIIITFSIILKAA